MFGGGCWGAESGCWERVKEEKGKEEVEEKRKEKA